MFYDYLEQLYRINTQLDKYSVEFRTLWINNIFLTWRWWLCILLTVLSWSLWIKFRKKQSSSRLLFAGFFVIIIAMLLDDIGIETHTWSYSVDIDPITPSFIMWDMSLLPTYTMAFLQYKPSANPFIKAIIYSALPSFIFQPLFEWLKFYNPGKWKHYYSFPIFILIYLIAHLCVNSKSFDDL
jgi:hypothetical protein